MRFALLLLGGCRIGFDPLGAGKSDGGSDGGTADAIEVRIVGHGAVVAGTLACGDTCTFPSLTPLTFAPVAGEAWRFARFGGGCGAAPTCEVQPGATLTATFDRAAITANRAFVSSSTLTPTAGRAALDGICANHATAGGLQGTFVALVSSSVESARDRLAGSRGWVRLDGLPLVDQPTDFGMLSLPRGVELDELGTPRGDEFVMTGSLANGATSTAAGHRADWTDPAAPVEGGLADAGADFLLGRSGRTECSGRIYCFEIGRDVPVSLRPPAFPVGRYVFVTAANFVVGNGLDAADAQCRDEASAAGLPGSYRAILATTTESVVERVGSLAGIWRRPDGVVVTRTALDVAPHDATILVTADGQYPSATVILVGATSATARGTAAESCNDWTDANGTSVVIQPFRFPFQPSFSNGPCAGLRIACAEVLP